MDEASRNVVAFLEAIDDAEATLLALMNELNGARVVREAHKPFTSLPEVGFLWQGLYAVGHDGHNYELSVTVHWRQGAWVLRAKGGREVDVDPYYGGHVPDLLGLPERTAGRLDEFIAELRAAVADASRSFRALFAPAQGGGGRTEPGAAPDRGGL